jgi:hypothetical protein
MTGRPGDSLVLPAIVAGMIGGVLFDIFLAILAHTTPITIWLYVASVVIGNQSVFAQPGYAFLGVAVHIIVSIGWALLYVMVFNGMGQLRNWILGGVLWGVLVDAVMQGIVAVRTGSPWGQLFTQALFAHIVFYGLPVAYFMARSARRT